MNKKTVLLIIITLLLSACSMTPEPTAPRELQVMTHNSFSISEEVIAQFEEEQNVQVQFLQAGDAGKMLNQAILSRDNPQADLIYGLDNTFLSRALEADILEPYAADGLAEIPTELQLDPQNRVVPVDYGDVCLNYDRAYFEEHDLPVPQSLVELTQPEYEGLLVVENPASSSPGLAFLVVTVGVFGEEGYLDFWADLRENDLLVVDGWNTAYYGEFSGGAGSEGTRPLVVSYATSPAAEVYFSEEELTEPPTGAITAPGTCFRQIEFAGILKGTENEELAQEFIEFLLSAQFQTDIPLQMWVFPANNRIKLPESPFTYFADSADQPVEVSPEAIEAQREAWIEAWTETVLR